MLAVSGHVASPRDITRALVVCELSRSSLVLGFAAPLEEMFEADTRVRRVGHLIRSGVLAMVVSNIFLVADANLIPDVFRLSVILHVVCTIGYAAVLFHTATRANTRLLEAEHGLSQSLALLVTIFLLHISHAPQREFLCSTYVLFIVYMNTVLRLRFTWCLGYNVVAGLAAAASLFGGDVATGVREITALCVATASAFTLYASYAIEAGERRSYLLALDQRLSTEQLAEYNDRLNTMSTTDWLTGVANRRGLERHLRRLWDHAASRGETLSLLMIDVDYFKLFNDHRGHPAGDACLTTLATLVGQQLRQGRDILCRYGGEEFGVLLPETTLAEATRAADRIRQAVEDLSLVHGAAGAGPSVTVSIGAEAAEPGLGGAPEQLIAGADRALYVSKQNGRNRVHPAPLLQGWPSSVRVIAK